MLYYITKYRTIISIYYYKVINDYYLFKFDLKIISAKFYDCIFIDENCIVNSINFMNIHNFYKDRYNELFILLTKDRTTNSCTSSCTHNEVDVCV